MADIELVIKISEEEYINIKNAINSLIENDVERASMSKVCLAILDGTPLPKVHGDLIDRKLALSDRGLCEFHRYDDYLKMRNYLKSLPSVIEAESEEDNAK